MGYTEEYMKLREKREAAPVITPAVLKNEKATDGFKPPVASAHGEQEDFNDKYLALRAARLANAPVLTMPKRTSATTLPTASRDKEAETEKKKRVYTSEREGYSIELDGSEDRFYRDIKDIIAGAAKKSAAAYVNNEGTAIRGEAERQKQERSGEVKAWQDTINAYREVLADPTASESEKDTAKDVIADLERRIGAYDKAYGSGGANERSAEKVWEAADKVSDSADENINRAMEGKSGVGKLLTQAGVSGVQMGIDAMMAPQGLTLLPMFMRASGAGAQEARRNGADFDTANTVGGLTGLTEVATEMMFDGLAGIYGKGAADDLVARWISKHAKTPAMGRALSYAASAGGEAVEEVVSGLVDPAIKSIYNKKSYGENFDPVELVDGALVGGILGVLGGGAMYNQAVEEGGHRAVGTEIRKGGDKAVQAVIDAGMMLGEDTDAHRTAAELQEQIDAGKSVADEDIGRLFGEALGESMRETAPKNGVLRSEDNKNPRTVLPTYTEVEKQQRIARAESRTEATGIEFDVPEETIAEVKRIGDKIGREIVFYSEDAQNGMIENGWYDRDVDDALHINAKSGNPVAQIISHELTHSIETAQGYNEFSQYVLDRVGQGKNLDELVAAKQAAYAKRGVMLNSERAQQEIVAEYVQKHLLTSEQEINETVQQNRGFGQWMLRQIDKLLAMLGNENAQERVFLNRARKMYAKALAETQTGAQTAGAVNAQVQQTKRTETLTELQERYDAGEISEEEFDREFDRMFDESYDAEAAIGGGMPERQYSIEETEDGRAVAVVDNDILSEIDTTSWDDAKKAKAKKAAKEALLAFKDGVQVNGIDYKVNKRSRDEYARSRDTERKYHRKPDVFADKMRAAANVNDIITATTAWANDGGLKYQRNDNFVDFTHGDVLIRAGQNKYKAETVVGITDAGEYVFYDVVDMEPTSFKTKEGSSLTAASDTSAVSAIQEDPSADDYSTETTDVNRQHSFDEVQENERKRIAGELRGMLERGASGRELKRYVDGADNTNRIVLKTVADEDAERIVNAAHREGVGVEEYLRENAERYETDGKWNEEARRALALERETSGRQYNRSRNAQFSISEALPDDLERVLNNTFSSASGEVYLGESSNFLTDVIGAEKLTKTMPASKAYANMVSEEKAREEGRYRKDLHYHAMGKDRLINVLTKSEEPILAFADAPDSKGNERLNRIVLVTGEKNGENNYIVIDELGTDAILNGKNIKANKTITSYGREHLQADIEKAIDNHRLLYVDKKRDQNIAGRKGANSQTAIRDSDLENNIRLFWSKVKWKNGEMPMSFGKTEGKTAVQIAFERAESRKQHSFSEAEETTAENAAAEESEKPTINRETIPSRAQAYLRGTEKKMLNRLGGALGVSKFADRAYLEETVRAMSDEYLANGKIPQERLEQIFDEAYEQGIVVDSEFYDEYKWLKDELRDRPVSLSEADKSDFDGWGDWRRSMMGKLRIADAGTRADIVYEELRSKAPELFPAEITHPADQLRRMGEVAKSIEKGETDLDAYHGADREDFKSYAKRKFLEAAADTMQELQTVRLYAEERMAAKPATKAPGTMAEVMEAYGKLKDARRAYERVRAKKLLTKADEAQVGRLLRGDIEPEHLKPDEKVRGILAVYEARKEYEKYAKLLTEYKKSVRAQAKERADSFLETANEWKDKRAGILYSRETMERNIYDIVPDEKVAKKIIDAYFKPVHDAEARSTRFKTEYRDRVRALELSRKVAEGNEVSEAHAVQLLGEAMDNIEMLKKSDGRSKKRDGKTIEDWKAIIDDLHKSNPNMDWKKVDAAIESFRGIYDELFKQLNDVRVKNGYEPINYRHGYFPHFQAGEAEGVFSQFGRAFGIDTSVSALPTTINGLTQTFKPGITWFGAAQERRGFDTAYDAVEGFDKYINGAADVIFQTDNIQNLRALAAQIRYRTTDEGIREQIDKINARQDLTVEEKETQIRELYDKGKFTLGNFVNELDEYTNLLANKKSKHDRSMEALMGRKAYEVMKAFESRVGANMVAGNLASAMTNFIPLTQAGAQIDTPTLLKGMWQTLQSFKADDGMVGASSFLTNRHGSDPIVQAWMSKVSSTLGSPMEYIDSFAAGSIVRARYLQNLHKGMSEAAAMSEADSFAAGVMADRSKGSMPTMFSATNPVFKLFTQFQLEVNNQWSEVFKDLPRAYRDRGVKALTAALLRYFFGAWIYNEIYEKLVGRRPAMDPFGILNDTVGDLTGYELPNAVDLIGGAVKGELPSFEVKKEGVGTAMRNTAKDVIGELPFISGLADGGRIPVSSAIPDVGKLWDAATDPDWGSKKRRKAVLDELSKIVYVLPPFGGNQLQKLWKGAFALKAGGSYSVNSAGEDILQYPIYRDEGWATAGNAIRMALFGKNSAPTAQDWVENGFNSMSVKQTIAYKDMLDAGLPERESYELLAEIGSARDTEDAKKAEVQREILRESKVADKGKAIAYYTLMANDKERELMDALDDSGEDTGKAVYVLMDLKEAEKRAEKLEVLRNASISDKELKMYAGHILGKDLETDSGGKTQYAKLLDAMKGGLDGKRAVEIIEGGGDLEKYSEMQGNGVTVQNAFNATKNMMGLEPKEGKDAVSDLQKWRAVVDAIGSAADQLKALEAVMDEKTYAKVQTANSFGVKPEEYVRLKELLPMYDANGNGSYSNAEVEAAIDAMTGRRTTGIMLPGNGVVQMSNEQRGALWQIVTGSKSAKNNPYSAAAGQRVLNGKDSGGQDYTGKIVLPK